MQREARQGVGSTSLLLPLLLLLLLRSPSSLLLLFVFVVVLLLLHVRWLHRRPTREVEKKHTGGTRGTTSKEAIEVSSKVKRQNKQEREEGRLCCCGC